MSDKLFWMPTVTEETNAGVREISLYTRQFMERNVFLNGPVDSDMANRFLAQMMYLSQIGAEEINVYINSPGGEVDAGLMIHEPLLRSGVGGSASSIKNISDSIIETRNLLNGILAKHTGKSIEEIQQATSFDNYMNAEESVAFGLCDEVLKRVF